MGFIFTSDGRHIATSEVLSARPTPDDRVILTLRDGSETSTMERFWQEALQLQGAAPLPAQPGYFRLEPSRNDDDERVVHKEPVIGWLVNALGRVVPVTAQGVNLEFQHVLVPDGRVVETAGWYPSLEAWKAQNL